MPVVAQGGSVPLDAYFKNSLGEPVNDTNITLDITDIFGAPVLHVTMPDITNPDIGRFVYEWRTEGTLPIGDYIATWAGDFAGERLSGEDKVIVVPPGYIATSPLTFMVRPDDYDAVRGLLGVTALDVEDKDIELSSFGQQAEYLIKSRAGFWATMLNNPVTLFPLRMAAIYKTAWLMAETWVHGGTVGFVFPLRRGEWRDWTVVAPEFEAGYNYWMGVVMEADPASPPDHGVWTFKHGVAIGGPTRRRITSWYGSWYGSGRLLGAAVDPYAASFWSYPPYWPWPSR